MGDRRGVTLVELLVVAVIGTLVIIATYNVLITNQRTYTVNAAKIQGQQTVRAGMEILFSELREISPRGGDLVRMRSDTVTIRVMRAAGLVCDSVPGGGLFGGGGVTGWKVVNLGDTLEHGDDVWLFAENDSSTTADDVWFTAVVDRRGAETCAGRDVQEVRFTGGEYSAEGPPTVGSLVRAFETYTYGIGDYGGRPYLFRKLEPDGGLVPLVGPLMPGGLTFEYLDGDGNTSGVPAEVRQIVVTLRTRHDARDARGNPVTDSLSTRVHTRN